MPFRRAVVACRAVGQRGKGVLVGLTAASTVALAMPMPGVAAEPAAVIGPSVGRVVADGPSLLLTLGQEDGTAPWSADDAAGHDSGPDNGIARTNDTVSYDLGIRFEGDTHTSTTIEFKLPKGQELVQLPPYCEPGSSVTPADIPDPAVPLTATSWQSLPQQTVSCVLKDYDAGQALNFRFVTKIRAEVPNGTELDLVEFSVHSAEAPTPVTIAGPDPVTVSAKADFDLSKRYNSPNNNGPIYSSVGPCFGEPNIACMLTWYPVTINVPVGGKGASPLQNGISFVDDISPEAFYGPTVWANAVALAGSDSAARAKYAPRANCLGKIGLGSGMANYLPLSSLLIPGATTSNSVRESGTATCNPAHSAGDPVTVTITGADTSATTVPWATGKGNTLPVNTGTIVSFEFGIGVPMAAVTDLGIKDGGAMTLSTTNTYSDVQMKDLEGNPVVDDPSNNTRQSTLRLQLNGSADKFFSGIWGQPGNTPQLAWDGGGLTGNSFTQGPPGSGRRKDGNTVVAPGQAIQSSLIFGEQGIAGTGTEFSRTVVACDTWDPSRLMLAADPDWAGNQGAKTASNGKPVWVAAYWGANGTPIDPATINTPGGLTDGLVVEYSSGAFGTGQDSKCGTGTWYTNPDDVPGAAKSTDAEGRTTWDGINRVRVRFNTQWPVGDPRVSFSLVMAIGQIVKHAGRPEEPIGNWESVEYRTGVHSAQDTITAPTSERLSTYKPATHSGGPGDRLWEGTAQARIRKYVKNPGTGEFTDTAVPLYSSGQNVTYRMNPSLTGDARPGAMEFPVTVEDCLPRYQVYASSKRSSGAAISPQVVQMGAPADAEIACPTNQQYVRWNLGNYAVGELIDPVEVTADILDVARNATYSNVTVVASPADPSPVKARTDNVQMQLIVPTGIKVAKTVDRPLIEVNPATVTRPRRLTWSIFFANIDGPSNVADVDVIDVLPDNSVAGNDFTGQLLFDKATVVAGDKMTIHYTKAAHADIALDPRDGTNSLTSGTTVWCDAPDSGAVTYGAGVSTDCPASAAEVTGIRITRPGPFSADEQFQVDVAMTPVGNRSGDIYVNRTSAKASGVSQSVGPARRVARVVASQVGDRVWEDTNRNGLQDDGEPGIPGWPVRLTGTDLDGNRVDLTTTTDANGDYLFAELASGRYRLTFDPSYLNANSTFTVRDVDGDSRQAKDSDADSATGATDEFNLSPNTSDGSWDAGVVVDRNVDIGVEKRLVSRTALDENNKTTVTYEIAVANSGTAEGRYSLEDVLQFGKGIKVDDATVSNVSPGSIATNSAFNGTSNTRVVDDQSIAGGETHVYVVTVTASLATALSATAGDCLLASSENGTGFLNRARVTSGGVSSDATACDTVPPRRTANLSIDKRLVHVSPLDDHNRATVTYLIRVKNDGAATGPYALRDELQYGGGVAVEEVKVANTQPGDLAVNSDFNGMDRQGIVSGQEIRPGESHEYVVTVRGRVATTISVDQSDCEITTSESGTGFLNEAHLEVDGVETTDVACADVVEPPEVSNGDAGHGFLPSTGGPGLWLALLGVAAMLIGLVLVRRRSAERDGPEATSASIK